jgi:DNA-binding MarR family transcriptional regulator
MFKHLRILILHGSLSSEMSKKTKPDQFNANVILGKLERLACLVRAASHVRGLTPAQWDILRFIARANRFSNSPIAASHYVGATKGTTSQSIASLVAKNLLLKVERKGDHRSVALLLSDEGVKILGLDPLYSLENSISLLGSKTQKRFSKAVSELLQFEHTRQKQPSFGACTDCRFYRNNPDHCMKFSEPLKDDDLARVCVEHVKR